MIQELIYPISNQSYDLYIRWSNRLLERTQRPNISRQIPFNMEFAPGICFYDPEFLIFKTELYKAISKYVTDNHVDYVESECEAPTSDNQLLSKDWSFILNAPGSRGFPSGYMQGSQDCDYYDESMFKRYQNYIDSLNIRFSLDNYSGLIKPTSSSGLPYFSRDLPVKLAETLRINKLWYNHSHQFLKIKNPTAFHELMVKNGLALCFMMNSRLQPDNFSKLRLERTIWNELINSDRGWYSENPSTLEYFAKLRQTLGDDFINQWFLKDRGTYYDAVELDRVYMSMMRLRSPYMGSHINITDSAISPSIQNNLIEDYAHIFHISDRLTLEKRVNELQDLWGNVYMIALDYRHFEMAWPDEIQRINCRAIDKVLPEPWNTYYYRYMHSNVIMFSKTQKDFEVAPLFISKDYVSQVGMHQAYSDNDMRVPLKTEGNLSGHAYVALWNKLFGSFLVLEILQQALSKAVSHKLADYNITSDIQFINNGDDNLLFFKNKDDALKVYEWISKVGKIHTVEITTDYPSFNAMYLVKSKTNGYYYVRPSLRNYIARWVTPEYDYGLIKKGRAEFPNLGKHLRMHAFLAYDYHSEINEIMERLFYDIYHRSILSCFVLNETEELILDQEYREPDSAESVWNFFAATDIDRFLWDPRAIDAPIDVLKKYFFVIPPEDFQKFISGELK